jgi:hypothetical protein
LKAEFVPNQQQNSEGYIYILFTFTVWFFSLSMLPYLTDRLFQWVVETEGRRWDVPVNFRGLGVPV